MIKKSVVLNNVSLTYRIQTGFFKYKKIHAVKNLSFDVYKGEMLSLIGHNGSGKTTTLTMIAGIIYPDTGNIIVNGKVVPFLGLGIGFNPELTGKENIFLYSAIMGLSRRETKKIFDKIVDFSELKNFMDMKVKEYSSGMYVRLAFSVAIHTYPDILIIDEVLAVGDIDFQRKCLDAIKSLKKRGITILFVSHDMGLVARFSDRVLLLDNGEMIEQGKPEDVINKYMSMRKDVMEIDSKRRGSREVEIKEIFFNKESKKYKKGESINVFVKYKNNENIQKGICGFALYTETGILIAGPNIKDNNNTFINFKKEGTIGFQFSSESLLPGKYYLTIALYDKTNRFAFDHIEYADYFYIEGERKEYSGFIDIKTKWIQE